MAHCKKCGSFAINHGSHGRDGSEPDLCDVCYWRKRADVMAALIRELVSVITHDGASNEAHKRTLGTHTRDPWIDAVCCY